MPPVWLTSLTVFGILAAVLYGPLMGKLTVFGVFRSNIVNMHGSQLTKIPNSLQCEDLHHHVPSNLLFTACQTDDPMKRRLWFPPLAKFNHTHGVGKGSLVVVDPKTLQSTHLEMQGFKGPFVTHGIDVFSFPADPNHVTLFAVNHLPHPSAGDPTHAQHARSQIEVFRHTIGTSTAKFIRSIRHPLITTPNDIFATSPTSFYVTNDHYYRDGPMRVIEDFGGRSLTGWSDTVHVSFGDSETADASADVVATTALTGLHNNNGLGHSAPGRPEEILVGDAAGGVVSRVKRNLQPRPGITEDLKLEVLEHIQLDSNLDNPSYFQDPYPSVSHDASGMIVAGLARGIEFMESVKPGGKPLPVIVWHVTRRDDQWEKRVIFQDDGTSASAAATAVLVPVDPAENDGKKQGWLFVTGFLSDSIVASLIDL